MTARSATDTSESASRPLASRRARLRSRAHRVCSSAACTTSSGGATRAEGASPLPAHCTDSSSFHASHAGGHIAASGRARPAPASATRSQHHRARRRNARHLQLPNVSEPGRRSARPPSAWSTANAPPHGERALRSNAQLERAAQAHTDEHGRRGLLRTHRPGGRHAARADARGRLHLQLARRLRSRREHRLGHALDCDADARSSPPGWPRPGTARTSSTRHFRDTGDRRLAAPARLARARPGRRHLHAGLRRHHHG